MKLEYVPDERCDHRCGERLLFAREEISMKEINTKEEPLFDALDVTQLAELKFRFHLVIITAVGDLSRSGGLCLSLVLLLLDTGIRKAASNAD